MADRLPPPDAIDAAVHVLRTRTETPAATDGNRPSDPRWLLNLVLGCLALAAIFGIGAAVWIGYQADQDRKASDAIDVRANEEVRCRAEFGEALTVADGRLAQAERVTDAASAAIFSTILDTSVSGTPVSPDEARARVTAYSAAIAAEVPLAVAYDHALSERDGATAACSADPTIRPTPPEAS